jgi:hypothetical protein
MAYNEILEMYWEGLEKEKQGKLLDEVAYALSGATNFTSGLIRLVGKSDTENLNKLFGAYPDLAAAAHAMYNGIVPQEVWEGHEHRVAELVQKLCKYEVTVEVPALMSRSGQVVVNNHLFVIPDNDWHPVTDWLDDDDMYVLNVKKDYPTVTSTCGVMRRLQKEKEQ